jgi:hypothetical protein
MSLQSIQDMLCDHLAAERSARERAPSLLAHTPHANASSAGGCARAIAFRVAGVEGANPPSVDSLFNFYIGDAVHDKIQAAVLAKIPEAEKEVNGVIENFITCRADLCYPAEDSKIVCCEIKSTSDFGFKLATGARLKSNGQWNKKDQQAEGPKREHVLQVGISAKSIAADYLCIVYARKTAAKDEPIIAEWRFKVADFDQEIQAEIERLRSIVASVQNGVWPDREYNGTIIQNPLKVRFPCGYCNYLPNCIEVGWGEVKMK